MKTTLLIALLSLLSCASEVKDIIPPPLFDGDQPPALAPNTPLVASGSNGLMSWQCHQDDYTEELIWIECQFLNFSNKPQETCVRIIISDATGQAIDSTRLVCSSILEPVSQYENFASFTKERRAALKEKCGLDTGRCTMSVVEGHRD